MAKQTFTAGQVLTATQVNGLQTNDFNQTVSTKTAAYTFVVGDRGTRVVLNDSTARTFTIDNSIFSAGDTIYVHNINTGVLTIAAGAGVTLNGADVLTVAQWQSGTIYFTSASSAIFFPTAKTVSGGGLVLISSTTIGSAVASVAVSGAFSSTYDNYKIIVSGGAASADANTLRLQFGSTTGNYYWSSNRATLAGVTGGDGASSDSAIQVGFTNTATHNLVIDVLNPNLAKSTVVYSLAFDMRTASGRSLFNAGFLDNTTSYTAFTLLTSAGTITGGTICVYGYANS